MIKFLGEIISHDNILTRNQHVLNYSHLQGNKFREYLSFYIIKKSRGSLNEKKNLHLKLENYRKEVVLFKNFSQVNY